MTISVSVVVDGEEWRLNRYGVVYRMVPDPIVSRQFLMELADQETDQLVKAEAERLGARIKQIERRRGTRQLEYSVDLKGYENSVA